MLLTSDESMRTHVYRVYIFFRASAAAAISSKGPGRFERPNGGGGGGGDDGGGAREKMVYNLARTTSIAFTEEPSVCAIATSARTCTHVHMCVHARDLASARPRDRGLSTSPLVARSLSCKRATDHHPVAFVIRKVTSKYQPDAAGKRRGSSKGAGIRAHARVRSDGERRHVCNIRWDACERWQFSAI
jgi:hypothetical protein